MSENSAERFSYLYEPRSEKPRESGITFVLGDGRNIMGTNTTKDLMEFAGEWIDWYKLVVASIPFQSPELIQRKLDLFEEHDVQAFPGGNFLEIAVNEGVEERYLEDIRAVGCPRVEVSRTAVAISVEEKAELIERATEMGLDVVGEVGRKPSEVGEQLSTQETIDEMKSDLDAGADKVIYETEAVVEDLLIDGKGKKHSDEIPVVFREIIDAVGKDNIIFELPLPLASNLRPTTSAAWFINNIGPEVNLGNVMPHWINLLEQQRRGIGPKTYDYGK